MPGLRAYYNENEPFALAWLKELMADGLIAPGFIDDRDIRDVRPEDLRGFDRCHFFAGIGGWDYALGLAGWDGPVWTGSCPCQPFSAAGKGAGFHDSRHLWPTWFRLIRECRPPVVFGEQVASPAGLAWFDHVSVDLEAAGYAVGAADLCAAGVSAPHIRQRLFFVAHAERGRCESRRLSRGTSGAQTEGTREGFVSGPRGLLPGSAGADGELDDAAGSGLEGHDRPEAETRGRGSLRGSPGRASEAGEARSLDDAVSNGRSERGLEEHAEQQGTRGLQPDGPSPGRPWDGAIWLPCRDGKARPTQSGLQPLAHGVPNRVGTLRGAGNAIVPQVAAEFVRAYKELI